MIYVFRLPTFVSKLNYLKMKCYIVLVLLMVLCFVAEAVGIKVKYDTKQPAQHTWLGDTAAFIISTDNQLQLNATAVADQKYVSTVCETINDAHWMFHLTTQFNPSSANYARVWLVADNANPNMVQNGICVEVGGADDNLTLYQVTTGVKKN